MLDTARSAAAPAARCRNCRRGSFILEPPFTSLDHLVGESKEFIRHSEAEHPGGLGVDNELELCRLQHRQIRGFGALEDTARVNTDLTIGIRNISSIAH